MRNAFIGGALLFCTTALAQSPLQTTMVGGNGGWVGGCVYFDLEVGTTLTIDRCDVNLDSLAGTAGALEVWLGPSTWVGNTGDASAWGLAAAGAVVAAGPDQSTECVFGTPLALGPGSYGVALRHVDVAARYTDGDGTNEVWSTAELTLRAGGATNVPFAGAPLQPRVANLELHYVAGGDPVQPARLESYGAGCYRVPGAFYETFDAARPFDLGGSTLHYRLNGVGGYDVTRTPGTFILPTNGVLPLSDDALAEVLLPFTFPFPGGQARTVRICSNGYLWLQPQTIADYTPTAAELCAGPARLALAWTDFNPGAIGSGPVSFERDPIDRWVTITYDDVWLHGTNGTALSTFQAVLYPNGDIDVRYGSVAHGAKTCIVGFTPGEANFGVVPPPTDFRTVSLHTGFARPLQLVAGPRPLLGSTVVLTTHEVPANALLALNLIAFVQVLPGVDLAGLGAPGCLQLVATDTADTLDGSFSRTLGPIPVLPVLNGLPVFSQSVALAPGVNQVGALTSNGIAMVLGDL